MDFFERQDKARKNTKLLVVYFVLAVICIIAAVYLACLLIFGAAASRQHFGEPARFALWNSEIFFYSAMGTLAVIVFGSLYQISALSAGGSAVAASLGGRPVNPNSTDLNERKLLNVVEEMAIASGIPMPKVYVMDNESGINAFAAGFTTNDAVVAVTRGTLQNLTRDELQGVIGHEFSHILNGDMRLNIRLMGIIFGILCLTVIGRILLRTGSRSHYRLGARNRGGNPLPLLGLALILIGWVGVIFGRLIQAAVSRQREFLADAAAVQFTRNPDGLAGALKKIGGLAGGSRMENPRAEEASHMFFGNAMRQSLFSAFATHPPLEQRIRAITPQWDGAYPPVPIADAEKIVEELLRKPPAGRFPPIISGLHPVTADMNSRMEGAAGLAPTVVRAQTVLPNLGKPTTMHLRYAEQLRDSFSENLRSATRDPISAQALIFAMLLSDDSAMRDQQLGELAKQLNSSSRAETHPQALPGGEQASGRPTTVPLLGGVRGGSTLCERITALYPEVAPLATQARLPMVNLILPALRLLRPDELQRLRDSVQWMVESDEQIELFEFMLLKILQRNLAPQANRRQVVQFYSMKPLAPDAAVLLSALANVSSADAAEVAKAFQVGAPYLRAGDVDVALLPREECGLEQVSAALDRLALAVPQIKKNVLEASVRVVGADGVIEEREAELLRAIGEALDCPIPPFVKME
jgi:Zn-dependent protease with chaperone function